MQTQFHRAAAGGQCCSQCLMLGGVSAGTGPPPSSLSPAGARWRRCDRDRRDRSAGGPGGRPRAAGPGRRDSEIISSLKFTVTIQASQFTIQVSQFEFHWQAYQ